MSVINEPSLKVGRAVPSAPCRVVPIHSIARHHSGNSKLIKGKLHDAPATNLFPAFSATGQDVWRDAFDREGDAIIISAVGARCGKCFLAKGRWSAIANTHVVWPDPEQIELKFLWYLLNDEQFWIRSGSAQPFVAVRKTFEKEILLPSVPEQRRIVAEIEKQFTRLEAGVSALKRVQANLKRYRAAVLKAACSGELVPTETALARARGQRSEDRGRKSEIGGQGSGFESGAELLARILEERRKNWLESNRQSKIKNRKYPEPAAPDTTNLPPLPKGWTWASAEQLCSTVASGSTPSADQLFQREGEVPFIKVYNLTFGGSLDFSVKPTFISEIVHGGRLGRSKAYPGDVLTNIVGPPLGKVSIVPDSFPEWNINQAIVVFRTTEAISNRLLAFWLRSESVLARLGGTAKATAGQFNVQVTTCRKLALPLPPLAEQVRIVAEVERRLSVVEELEAVVTANLQRATRLRQSILQKAFTGELTDI